MVSPIAIINAGSGAWSQAGFFVTFVASAASVPSMLRKVLSSLTIFTLLL
jgi:hypothetical protein